MKDLTPQSSITSNSKTLSDLQLKNNIRLSSDHFIRIHNTYKLKQQSSNQLSYKVNGIGIKQRSQLIKQLLLQKQIKLSKMPSKSHQFHQNSKSIPNYNKHNFFSSNISQQQNTSNNSNQDPQKKLQVELTNFSTKIKNSIKLTNKFKVFPKICKPLYNNNNHRLFQPILSSFDQNLKSIKALHYFVMEYQSKNTIISRRSRIKIQVASLTKIMTFYTILSICEQYNCIPQKTSIQIQPSMLCISGTTAQLQQNRIYTLKQLLYGMMLPSGNDAAVALATWGARMISPNTKTSIKAFVNRMNIQAKKLKLFDTFYTNPHGLPNKDNKTTCEDVAKLCCVCLDICLFRQIISTKIYKFKYYNKLLNCSISTHWKNTNKLLDRTGFIGIKTGITITAGPCLASAYKFLDKIYIIIIAKCNKPSRRFKDTRYLIAHCLSNIYYNQLNKQQFIIIQKLTKNCQDIECDTSDQENQFNFHSFGEKEIQKRIKILTEI